MAERREWQGYIYVRDNPGDQWRLEGPAPKRGTVITDPYRPKEEARKDTELDIRQGQLGVSQAAEARQQATLPADVRRAEAEAKKSEAEATAALKEQANAPDPALARVQRALQTDSVLQSIITAREQIGKGWSTGNLAGTPGFQGLWGVGQNSANLAATISSIQGSIINDTLAQLKAASASGASGYGSLTESEAQRLAAAVGALQQTQDSDALLANLAKVERHYRNALALLNKEDPRDPAIAEKYGILPEKRDEGALGAVPPSGGQVTSEGRYEPDPTLGGVNATVASMVRRGRSADEIRSYLNRVRPGLGDQAQSIDEAVAYARQYPGRPVKVDIEKQWVPATGAQKTLGDIGMSPLGTAAIGAADFLTAGTLDNMTGNPDLTRATMAGVQEENPWSYMLGQIGGGALGGGAVEALLARGGLTGLSGARAGDFLVGGSYGAGSADAPDQSRFSNAILGSLSGLGGGMLGRSAARVGGTAIGGISDELRVALDRAGVRMTPGQIFGGGLKRTEDRLSGFPLVGGQIAARRMEGLEDFNRAAMSEAVAPIGVPGPAQIGQVGVHANQDAIGAAYDAALNGRTFTADPQFQNEIAAALAFGRSIPQLGDQFDAMAANRVGTLFDPSGNITGRGFQDAVQGLRKASNATQNEVMGYEFDQGVGMMDDALRGMIARQAPDVLDQFDAANAAYRRQSVIDDAVLKALNQGGTFTPAQLGMASRQNAKTYGGKRAAARGDMPFNELQQAGQEVLPSKIPDSGTAGRVLLPGAAFLAGGGGGYAASEGDTSERAGTSATSAIIAALLVTAPYSQASRAALQRMALAERPQSFRKAGDVMVNNDTVAGLLASPASVIAMTDR